MNKTLSNFFVIIIAVGCFFGTLIPGMVVLNMMVDNNILGSLMADAYDGSRLYQNEPNGAYPLIFLFILGASLFFAVHFSNRVGRYLAPTE
jgi:hypothetical protein